MPQLIFRGSSIRFVDVRYNEPSKTVYTKINITASWTDKIREAMEWPDAPERYGAADLIGDLVATKLELIPNGDLKQHGFDLEAKTIDSFSVHPVKDDEGNVNDHELRFQITTTAAKAAQKLGAYLAVIGKGEAQLKVWYEAQSELENEADQQGKLISEEQAADTAEGSDGPTLAPTGTRHGARNKSKVN